MSASLTHDCRDGCTGSEPSLDRWNERTEHWYCPNGNDNCTAHLPHCLDCGSTNLHEGPNDPPPWCCCMDCGSANISDGTA